MTFGSRRGRAGAGAVLAAAMGWAAPPQCSDPVLEPSLEYGWVVGSARVADPDGDQVGVASTYRWLADGVPIAGGTVGEALHLPLDGGATGSDGEAPVAAAGLQWSDGRWGSAVTVVDGGGLAFDPAGNLPLDEATVELWTALTADGSDSVYTESRHVLMHYRAPDGDWIGIVQSADSGVLYVGGETDGVWYSAWSNAADTRHWAAGEWHHVAATWSDADHSIRFYLDGRLLADTNEAYHAPSGGGDLLAVGSDVWGTPAAYRIDELRILDRELGAGEIAARAARTSPPHPLEVWLPLNDVPVGADLVYEVTPSDGTAAGAPCATAGWVWSGAPVTDVDPPSTLLPAGTTALTLGVRTPAPAACRWTVGELRPWSEMTPFDAGAGGTLHTTEVAGIDPDPSVLNPVWVRTDLAADFALKLRYRCLGAVRPDFPRTGNLWGVWGLLEGGLEHVSRTDLLLGADALSSGQIAELRRLNPQILVLASINAVENRGLPESFYLHDVDGDRIEVWPDSYRLNLTKLEVAEHQAWFAYERMLASDLAFDGMFFDNVFTTQSWLSADIYGDPVRIDADEDGVEDDPEVLDAAWKAGVFHEIDTFRALMPDAVVSGHAMSIAEPGIAERFNGISMGFFTADVLEDEMTFTDLWRLYGAWESNARPPVVDMFESSPIDQFAYGYDYAPWDGKVPAETLEFVRTYYPWMRFGLALTLMRDGYFAHEWGDAWHGNDWWYDELDVDLGFPLGPPELVDVGGGPYPDQIVNGSFEAPLEAPWSFWVNTGAGAAASVVRDATGAFDGEASARVDVDAVSGTDWHIELTQNDRSLEAGATYELGFAVRADRDRTVEVTAQKGTPDWDWYGLSAEVTVDTEWREVTVPFTATATAGDAAIHFVLGADTGSVWLDAVTLRERPPDVYRRDFTHGAALLNGSDAPRTVELEPGFSRISGEQAPLHQVVVDDGDPAFTTTGTWTDAAFDSGEWQAVGPFFHDWGTGCRVGSGPGATAVWPLDLPVADLYTVQAWWPAAPEASGWSARARYEVVVNGAPQASAELDQRSRGDRFHTVGRVVAGPGDDVEVRLSCADGLPCVADALHVTSQARYNDGSPAESVTLAPLDGIVLRWDNPLTGDVDRDGDVDGADLLLVLAAIWGEQTPYDVDINDDGVVDGRDLMLVAAAITTRPPRPAAGAAGRP